MTMDEARELFDRIVHSKWSYGTDEERALLAQQNPGFILGLGLAERYSKGKVIASIVLERMGERGFAAVEDWMRAGKDSDDAEAFVEVLASRDTGVSLARRMEAVKPLCVSRDSSVRSRAAECLGDLHEEEDRLKKEEKTP